MAHFHRRLLLIHAQVIREIQISSIIDIPQVQPPEGIYQPLPEFSIRVFNLLPGSADSDIQCTLMTIPLHTTTTPRYSALSYVWGLERPNHVIKLNDRKFTIRKSLFDALLVLRQEGYLRILWINALCRYLD
ncbi:hypothetical protein B0J14DRAFT_84584 [Halenospora varia]|nr:hypothetical protein B0J14DRAFT_84584 [Halenospora varia]